MGLVPLSSLLDAAHYYMEEEGLMVVEEEQKVKQASPHPIPHLI